MVPLLRSDNGQISVFEFIKAMRELGLESQPQSLVAVFKAIDRNHDGSIAYAELNRLLRESVANQPVLKPLTNEPVHPVKSPANPKGGLSSPKRK